MRTSLLLALVVLGVSGCTVVTPAPAPDVAYEQVPPTTYEQVPPAPPQTTVVTPAPY
jgi:hypothetical protein